MTEARIPSESLVAKIAQALERVHWDGTGCGTKGPNACSNCYGEGSQMDVYEVVRFVLAEEAKYR